MLRLIGNNVAITPDKKKEKIGSIILPDCAKGIPDIGTVIARGPGKYDEKGRFEETFVKPGDRVLYHKYLPHDIVDEEGNEFIIVSEDHIIGVLT